MALLPTLIIPSPALSEISFESSPPPVPSYQLTSASLREIQFENISLQDLLFQVRYLDALLQIFATLPLTVSPSHSEQYNQTAQVIDWPRIGHPEFVVPYSNQNDVENRDFRCRLVQNWFAFKVGRRLSYTRPYEKYQKFLSLNGFLSVYAEKPMPFALRPDLRVSNPLRKLQSDISYIIIRAFSWKNAICNPFPIATNPLRGEPSIFNILSDVEQILQNAIHFQGLST